MPVHVELVTARHIRGVETTPIELSPSQHEAILRIRFAENAGPFNTPLAVQATARLTRAVTIRGRPLRKGDRVVAVTPVEIVSR